MAAIALTFAALWFGSQWLEREPPARFLPPPPPSPTNAVADDPAAAHLGQFLFYSEELSPEGVSCATCHDPTRDWTDGRVHARGIGDLTSHTPSLWNVAYGRWFFWDGRADSLWAQALEPLEHPREMGTSRLALLHHFEGDPELREAYENVFGSLPDTRGLPDRGRPVPGRTWDPLHEAYAGLPAERREAVDRFFANVGKALAAFQRRIVSDDSRLDRDDLSESARRGRELFHGAAGCNRCHDGPNFTDGEFHNLGLPRLERPLPPEELLAGRADAVHDHGPGEAQGTTLVSALQLGRYAGINEVLASPFNGLGRFSDSREDAANLSLVHLALAAPEHIGQRKTPSLRNVARTAPYMHDGRFATLREVLEFYSELPGTPAAGEREELLTPLRLRDEQIDDLLAFLQALSGSPVPEYLAKPPPSPLYPE